MSSSALHSQYDSAASSLFADVVDCALAKPTGESAYQLAYESLLAALASGMRALQDPECVRVLAAILPKAWQAGGARVPGTSYELDPANAAFGIGTTISWAEFPSSSTVFVQPCTCVSAILAVADYLSRRSMLAGRQPPVMRDVFAAMIKAQAIQTLLVSAEGFDGAQLDYPVAVQVGSAAVITAMLGGARAQVLDAVSSIQIDAPAVASHQRGSSIRMRDAISEAASRAVRQALGIMQETSVDYSSVGTLQGVATQRDARARGAPVGDGFSQMPSLEGFLNSVTVCFKPKQAEYIKALVANRSEVETLSVCHFVAAFVKN